VATLGDEAPVPDALRPNGKSAGVGEQSVGGDAGGLGMSSGREGRIPSTIELMFVSCIGAVKEIWANYRRWSGSRPTER
jgi:hypothetical protein